MQVKVCIFGISVFCIFGIFGVTQGSFCPQPPKPEDGDIDPTNDSYSTGYRLSYHCYGNTLQSSLTSLTCLNNGIWDYDPPYCDKTINIAHGNLIGDGYTSVNYRAVDGNFKTCLSSNTPWSIYETILQNETIVRAVRITANSDLNFYRIYLKDKSYKTLECNGNSSQAGNQKVIFCQEPKSVNKIMIMKHGKLSENCELCEVEAFPFLGSCSTQNLFAKDGAITYNRESARLQCDEGFQPIGNSSSSCYSNGLWSNDLDCKPIPCQLPPDVPEAKWINPLTNASNENEFVVDTKLELFCNNGFELEGSAVTITCTLGGFWSSSTKLECKRSSDSTNSHSAQTESDSYIAAGTVVVLIFVITICALILLTVFRRRKKEQRARKEQASYSNPGNGTSNCREEYTYTNYKEDEPVPSIGNPMNKRASANPHAKCVKFLLPSPDGSTTDDVADSLKSSETSKTENDMNAVHVTPSQYDNASFVE